MTGERADSEGVQYKPHIRIIIDIKENILTVSDNGTGLTKEKYEQFLAPSFTFRSFDVAAAYRNGVTNYVRPEALTGKK